MLRRAFAFSVGWLFAAALYLLLIDITDLPELIVGAGAALLAAAGLELVREQDIFDVGTRAGWLRRLYRPLIKAPGDIVIISIVAIRQLLAPRRTIGVFRAVPFADDEGERLRNGKRALAESLGSFAPNTIIVGVDGERGLLLGHQLRRTGGDEAIDVLDLG